MKNKLFVGGIAWKVDDDQLRDHFEQYGVVVDARIIRDRETGRSRGFGFVTFESGEDAAIAQRELDGSEHEGRTIRVNEAEERRPPLPEPGTLELKRRAPRFIRRRNAVLIEVWRLAVRPRDCSFLLRQSS